MSTCRKIRLQIRFAFAFLITIPNNVPPGSMSVGGAGAGNRNNIKQIGGFTKAAQVFVQLRKNRKKNPAFYFCAPMSTWR